MVPPTGVVYVPLPAISSAALLSTVTPPAPPLAIVPLFVNTVPLACTIVDADDETTTPLFTVTGADAVTSRVLVTASVAVPAPAVFENVID